MAEKSLNYSWRFIVPLLLGGLGVAIYIGVYHTRPTSALALWFWFGQALVAFVAAGYGMRETRKNLAAARMAVRDNPEDLVYTRGHLRQDVLMTLGFGAWGLLGIIGVFTTNTSWYRTFATADLVWVEFIFMVNYVMNVTLRARMRRARNSDV